MAYAYLGASPPPPQGRVDRFGNPIAPATAPPPQVAALNLRPLLPGEKQGDHRAEAIAARTIPDPAAPSSSSRLPLYLGLAGAGVLGVVLLARRKRHR